MLPSPAVATAIDLRWDRPRRVHLVGIGGAGMRSLAKVLLEFGWEVSGSDVHLEGLDGLTRRGVSIYRGHHALVMTNDIEVVIFSDAIGPANVERQRAVENNAVVLSYAEFLGHMSRISHTVAIAGTHGKSTTTAMTADIFRAAGHDPTTVLGATRPSGQPGGRAGNPSRLLVEACEYQRNFLHLNPDVAVLLGFEWDHVDCYPSPHDVETAFAHFVRNVSPDGLVIAPEACPCAQAARRNGAVRTVTFGLHDSADWRATQRGVEQGRYRFDINRGDRHLTEISLQVAGQHNLMNALAAATVAAECGVPATAIRDGLSTFRGLRRRLELVGNHAGVTLIDDYGHHPREVEVTLAAVRAMYPNRRLWCIFQPHQGDRTAALLESFARSLQNTDRLCIADVFQARPGGRALEATAPELATRCRALGAQVAQAHDTTDIANLLTDALHPGDLLLTIGAGNIRNVIHEWTDRVRRHCATG